MKSFGHIIKILAIAFICIFLLNMLVMHVIFDTNVFNPVSRSEPEADLSRIRFEPENTEDADIAEEEAFTESTAVVTEDYYQYGIYNEAALSEGQAAMPESEGEEPDSTYFMTTGEVAFLENLSMLDKLEALSLISKVGREEADRIYDFAIDGITYTEMKDIEAVLARHLDKDEMAKLTNLLQKSKKQYSIANE